MPYRFGLLAPADRAASQDGSFVLARRARSGASTAHCDSGLATPLADDPFGWLEHWLAGLPLATSNLGTRGRPAGRASRRRDHVLVIATLAGSAYESTVQHAVLDAVARAGEGALRRRFPTSRSARTGAVFYAEAARSCVGA